MQLTKNGTSFRSSTSGFDQQLERYHWVLAELLRGNAQPMKALFSHRDDVTFASPSGGVAHGWPEVGAIVDETALQYRDGEVTRFETLSKCATAHLAYVVELELYSAKVGTGQAVLPVALRVTSVFRPEDGTWKLVHRHADPTTSARAREPAIQQQIRE